MSMQPAAGRQSLLDALRGFALLGILVVNIGAFASPFYGLGVTDPMARSALGQAVSWMVALLFETKFYLLFSFLFGYSFTLQMQSAERDGKAFVPRMLRRLAGLWTIGVLHAVLLYHGDILTTYAVLGTVLLMLRRQTDHLLSRLAIGLVMVTALSWAGLAVLHRMAPLETDPAATTNMALAAMSAYRGSAATVVAQHLQELSLVWIVTCLMQAPTALAMFLAGLMAGRQQLFLRIEARHRLFQRLLAAAVLIGLPGAAVYAHTTVHLTGTPWELAGLAIGLLTAPFLTAGYAGGMMLLFQTGAGRPLVAMLAPAGRMALSNYLLQSAVCAWIFLAYGLRLMGQVTPFESLMLAILIFTGQLLLSRWWMNRFAYGPLEWLLRAFTNLQVPLMRSKQV